MKEALCGDSGAILGHCGSTLGVSLAGAKVQSGKAQLAPSSRPRSVSIGDRHEIEFIVPHLGSRDCSVVGELRSDCDSRNSSQFCSNYLAASRQEALSFRRFGGPTTSAPACSTAFWAESSMLFGCSASFSPFSGMSLFWTMHGQTRKPASSPSLHGLGSESRRWSTIGSDGWLLNVIGLHNSFLAGLSTGKVRAEVLHPRMNLSTRL